LRECPWYKKQMTNTIKVYQEDYTTMQIYTQDDFKITKKDIDAIQEQSEAMEKIDFAKWIAFETRLQMDARFSHSKIERDDIINALEHLQSIYEGTERVKYHPICEITKVVSTAHWDARNLNSLCEEGKALWEDVMNAFDVYEVISGTQRYLDFNTHHYGKLK